MSAPLREANCVCKTCGLRFYAKPSQIRLRNGGQYCSRRCKYAHPDSFRRGEAHAQWKGPDVGPNVGRARAQRMYVLGDCEHCGARATDRHHVNGNTSDNRPENIQRLCRRCHMTVDGRIAALRLAATRKLTAQQATEIRQRYDRLPRAPSGRRRKGTVTALAAEYGIGAATVKAIVTGRIWRQT